MAKSPEEMAAAMIANFEAKTGKTLEAWLEVTQASGLEKHGQIVKMLKTDHGMTHGFANLAAHSFLKKDAASQTAAGTDLVAMQYEKKASLRPIYDRLIQEIEGFGSELELAPKKAYVSLRRKKQFALIQPSTKTRVDVGIQLKGDEATDRLELSGSWNAMVSHRVRLSEVDQVDDELIGWLREAFDRAG